MSDLNKALFRTVVAPEYAAKDDATLDIFADEAALELSKKKWGKRYPRGLAYITAHLIKFAEISTAKNSGNSGQLKRTRVGKLEREYAVSSGSGANDSYNMTTYGKEYIRWVEIK